ncbi:flagellin [Billgrantia gudaonensis]|uniref:Flagellin n=1 Tax=Billgrantia gudaonensis TaxID=376427 RepID=A0A1G8SZJ8_9GAMM|nr:flagellin [Halomonas gudaonensis]SDJ34667.1 flagellin [Halomonas gudaonensis]
MSVINTNITALIGQNNLKGAQNSLQQAQERLSSGLRINGAKDDAAGQAIANRMTSTVTGLNQAARNANDGISLAQTAEGALDQINDNLQRIRELTVQAQNDTNTAQDIDSIQEEVNERLAEIDRVTSQAEFNGRSIFDNASDGTQTDTSFSIQVGANDGQEISISISAARGDDLGTALATAAADGGWNMYTDEAGTAGTSGNISGTREVNASGFDVLSGRDAAGAQGDALEILDNRIAAVDEARSNLGAMQNRFETALDNIETTSTNLQAARSRIEDADYAVEVSNMTRAQILEQAGTSILAQANQSPQSVLSLLG